LGPGKEEGIGGDRRPFPSTSSRGGGENGEGREKKK